jgi:RNA polymerase sigma factor
MMVLNRSRKEVGKCLRGIDKKATEAAQNEQALSCFVHEYEAYILKCASKASKRYITKSEDEWSVAMEAFCSAVSMYSYDKGSFLRFAELMISRRLIDFFRTQSKYRQEFSVSPLVFSGEMEEEENDRALAVEIAEKTADTQENSLKDEIEAAGAQFSKYGFSFFDLINCSPKSQKTKTACTAAVSYMVSYPLLCSEMRRLKNLPLKLIEKDMKVSRKILERHRKYIIAAIEILTGDYPGLADYMKSMKGRNFR